MLAITITATPNLSSSQHQQADKLIQQVQAHDHTQRDPYLSNQFNVFSDMPAFFLASQQHELVGLLTLYADEDPSGVVDVTLNVLPKYRRQAVARQLWQAAKQTLRQYGYQQVEFMTEQIFLEQVPALLQEMQLTQDPVHEFQMIAPLHHVAQQEPCLQVHPLRAADIEALVPVYCEAFDTSPDEARRYLTVSYAARDKVTYVGEISGQLIGYCAIDTGSYNYLFGLFIASAYRQQGLGARFLDQVMAQVADKPLKLGVESDNPIARRLYQKLGFTDETQVWYVKAKKGFWTI